MASQIEKGGRPFFKGGIRLANSVTINSGSAAPTNGTSGTGAGSAGPGSIYTRTNGNIYINTNTKLSPTWTQLATGAASGDALIADGLKQFSAALTDVTTNNVTSVLHGFAPKSPGDAVQFLNGAATPAFAAVKDSDLATTDVTTNNATSAKHGFTPKAPADATQFLNGAATPAFAAVKDADLATTDVTTNNVTSAKHGFAPKTPADAVQFLNGAATAAFAAVKDSDLAVTDVVTNNVTSSVHGFAPKAPADATKFLNGANPPAYAAIKDSDLAVTDITTNNASTSAHGLRAKLTNVARSYQDEAGTVRATVVDTGIANTWSTGAQSFAAATSMLLPTSAGYSPTAVGSVGYDSTQGALSAGGQGTVNGKLPRVLYVTNGTTDTLTAATINTTETQFASTYQIPASFFINNKVLRVTYLLTGVATATIPTSLFTLRLGAVGIGGTVVSAQTAAQAFGAGTGNFSITYLIAGTVTSGTVFTGIQGFANFSNYSKLGTAQPVAVGTSAMNINLTMTFGGNAASNTWTVNVMMVEELN